MTNAENWLRVRLGGDHPETMRVCFAVVLLFTLTISTSVARAEKQPGKRKVVAAATDAAKPKKKADRSIGAPWSGSLQAPTRLAEGSNYFIRRPHRAYGTRTTVELVKNAIRDTYIAFPKKHRLAIGDFSQSTGGWISEHASHQSGRDVDLGLFYKKPPKGYPESFVDATAKTLDAAATWKLVSLLARTHDDDGGVQYIFLDSRLHACLYAWAAKNKVSQKRIAAVRRVLRHEPNHADHMHVRFKCRERDKRCR